jgi:hypothetical protein
MTDLLGRLAERVGAGERVRWLLVTGVGAAVAAVGFVLVGLSLVTTLVWVSAPHADRPALEPVRAAGLLWLLAHRVGVHTVHGELRLAPLALTALVAFVGARAGGWAARSTGADDARSVAVATVGFAGGYGVLAGAVAVTAGTQPIQPRLWQAVFLGFLLAGAAGGLGGVWSTGLRERLAARVPSSTWPALSAGGAGLLVLLGGAAAVTALSLGLHQERAGQLFAAVAGGWVGALGVLLVCVAYLPNAAIWAASFAAGPGFAVGESTQVSLAGVELGVVPALPLLAALPGSGPAPPPAYAVVLVPLVAGVVTGLVARRRTGDLSRWKAALCAGAAGGGAGVLFGLLVWLSTGSAGGRLSPLGPSAWLTGAAVAVELAAVAPAALLVALLVARLRA